MPLATDAHLGGNNQRDRQPCIAVTKGDFNGDGQVDYGVLLTASDGNSAILAAAIRAGRRWELQKLHTFSKNELLNLYVTTARPGEFKQAEGVDPALRPGEVRSFRSKRQGIEAGTLEASAVCYFWTPRGWVHVWISD
jgi:hypothetical protein